MPAWLMKCLNTAAGALPAVGLGILLKYMNVSKWWVWLVFGYVCTSYLGLSMLATSLLALIAAVLVFKYLEDRDSRTVAAVGNTMGGDDYDE